MRDLNVSVDGFYYTKSCQEEKKNMLFDLRKRVKDDNGSQMIVIDESLHSLVVHISDYVVYNNNNINIIGYILEMFNEHSIALIVVCCGCLWT